MISDQKPQRCLFISGLGVNRLGGAGLCSLAFLQAACEIFEGRVDYVGPELDTEVRQSLDLANVTEMSGRSLLQQISQLVSGRSVDRLSPKADEIIRKAVGERAIVFVNGERSGRLCQVARKAGLRSVFFPHNHASSYLSAESTGEGLRGWLYRQVYQRNAAFGCEDASLRVFLTSQDEQMYRGDLGSLGPSISDGYFSVNEERAVPVVGNASRQLCINTNLELEQNQKGVLEFLEEVWPTVSAAAGDATLVVAGVNPSAAILAAADECERVRIIANPSEHEMETIFTDSRVSVATTRGGSGIKIRVGEALKRGLAVLSTESCAVGYEVLADGREFPSLSVYQTAGEAVEMAIRLLKSEPPPKAEIQRHYFSQFGFGIGCQRLVEALQNLPDR